MKHEKTLGTSDEKETISTYTVALDFTFLQISKCFKQFNFNLQHPLAFLNVFCLQFKTKYFPINAK